MKKYLWTIGGGWVEASSIADLKDFYRRSGNMQSEFVAFEIDDRGNKANITDSIKTEEQTSEKKWWKFWK